MGETILYIRVCKHGSRTEGFGLETRTTHVIKSSSSAGHSFPKTFFSPSFVSLRPKTCKGCLIVVGSCRNYPAKRRNTKKASGHAKSKVRGSYSFARGIVASHARSFPASFAKRDRYSGTITNTLRLRGMISLHWMVRL